MGSWYAAKHTYMLRGQVRNIDDVYWLFFSGRTLAVNGYRHQKIQEVSIRTHRISESDQIRSHYRKADNVVQDRPADGKFLEGCMECQPDMLLSELQVRLKVVWWLSKGEFSAQRHRFLSRDHG